MEKTSSCLHWSKTRPQREVPGSESVPPNRHTNKKRASRWACPFVVAYASVGGGGEPVKRREEGKPGFNPIYELRQMPLGPEIQRGKEPDPQIFKVAR